MKKAKAKLEKVREDYIEEWKRCLEGLASLGKIVPQGARRVAEEENKGGH